MSESITGNTVLRDQEKLPAAAPVATECGEPAFTQGPAFQVGPIPSTTGDGGPFLAAEVIFGETWAASYNAEIWKNENGFRDQADGFFE